MIIETLKYFSMWLVLSILAVGLVYYCTKPASAEFVDAGNNCGIFTDGESEWLEYELKSINKFASQDNIVGDPDVIVFTRRPDTVGGHTFDFPVLVFAYSNGAPSVNVLVADIKKVNPESNFPTGSVIACMTLVDEPPLVVGGETSVYKIPYGKGT